MKSVMDHPKMFLDILTKVCMGSLMKDVGTQELRQGQERVTGVVVGEGMVSWTLTVV